MAENDLSHVAVPTGMHRATLQSLQKLGYNPFSNSSLISVFIAVLNGPSGIALDNSIVTCTLGHREYVDAINLDGSAASSKDSNPTLKLNRNVIGQRLCTILRLVV